MLMILDERNNGGVNGAGTRAHHNAVKRGQAHGGINRNAVLDGRDRAAVAQVARDQFQLFKRLAQELSGATRNVLVGRTMSAVLADAVLLVVLVGNRVHISLRGHGEKEGRVVHRDHRRARHELLARVNTLQRGLIVQGSKFGKFVNLGNNVIVDNGGTLEVFTTLNNAMTNSVNLIKALKNSGLAFYQALQNASNRFLMVVHRNDFFYLVRLHAMGENAIVGANALAGTLGQNFLRFNVQQLILHR